VKFRDILTSHLQDDARVLQPVRPGPYVRRIYRNFMYELYLYVYRGRSGGKSQADDLTACLAVFKDEGVRVLFKLWSEEIRVDRHAYTSAAVERLASLKRGPFELIRDAKLWSGLPFTLKDRAALRMAGIDLPRGPLG
jgi:hypothetical protein